MEIKNLNCGPKHISRVPMVSPLVVQERNGNKGGTIKWPNPQKKSPATLSKISMDRNKGGTIRPLRGDHRNPTDSVFFR